MRKPTRPELLADYACKPMQRFGQIDVFIHQGGDSLINPDEDGDWTSAGVAYDLARSDCIRVRFPDGTPREDIARALRKMLAWVEAGDLWQPTTEEVRIGGAPFFGKSEPVEVEEYRIAGASALRALEAAVTVQRERHEHGAQLNRRTRVVWSLEPPEAAPHEETSKLRHYLVSGTIGWNDKDGPASETQIFRVVAIDESQAIYYAENALDAAEGGAFLDEPTATLDDSQKPQPLRVIWM